MPGLAESKSVIEAEARLTPAANIKHAAGSGLAAGLLRIVPYGNYTSADLLPAGTICYVPNGNMTFDGDTVFSFHRTIYITLGTSNYGSAGRLAQLRIMIPTRLTGHQSDMMQMAGRILTGTNWGEWIGLG